MLALQAPNGGQRGAGGWYRAVPQSDVQASGDAPIRPSVTADAPPARSCPNLQARAANANRPARSESGSRGPTNVSAGRSTSRLLPRSASPAPRRPAPWEGQDGGAEPRSGLGMGLRKTVLEARRGHGPKRSVSR